MAKIRRLIMADGTEVDIENPMTMKEAAVLIGADTLDVVTLKHFGRPLHVMLVDDHGWETRVVETANSITLQPVKPLRPINEKATALYRRECRPGATHQIAGDVVIVPDEDYGP